MSSRPSYEEKEKIGGGGKLFNVVAPYPIQRETFYELIFMSNV